MFVVMFVSTETIFLGFSGGLSSRLHTYWSIQVKCPFFFSHCLYPFIVFQTVVAICTRLRRAF
jgi:hypothetical protein